MENKKCTKCKKIKPFNDFYKDKRKKDGKQSKCKQCFKEYEMQNKERITEYLKNYRTKNKEKAEQYSKVYRDLNKEKIAIKQKEKFQRNKERYYPTMRINTQKNIAKKYGVVHDFSLQDWEKCLFYFGNECAYCGSKSKLQQEHVKPLKKGGGYIPSNILPSCKSCNQKKSNKDFEDWYLNSDVFCEARYKKINVFLQRKEVKTTNDKNLC